MNQFDLWARQDLHSPWGGQAQIVLIKAADPTPLRQPFAELEPLPPLPATLQDHLFWRYALL